MLIFALVCLALFLCSLGYSIWQKKQFRSTYSKLKNLFDNAITGDTVHVKYDESIQSALGDKILRYMTANKERLAGIQDDRNRIKTLISDISHQTKTPISNILLYSGLLTEDKSSGESALQLSSDIQEQAEKLKFLVEALVKMSRLEIGIIATGSICQPVKAMLSAAVSDVYPKLEERNIIISVSCPDGMQARFDLKWTKEAIFNILENAVKYSDNGGSVQINAMAYDMFVRIDIVDHGIGIREAEINDIFKRFYRSPQVNDREGVGIGLYLSREIIAMQEGYIKVSSALGKGSSFSVFLPRN